MGRKLGVGVGLLVAVNFTTVGCWSSDPAHAAEETQAAAVPATAGVTNTPASRPSPLSTMSFESITALTQSVDGKLRKVRGLTREERARLRRDVNAVQIERARKLGIAPGSPIEPLIAAGRLVRVADTTGHWVVRDLKYSEPYVTPATLTMLTEIGERFHARLDSLGVPRYRLDITSVLRTSDKQAALRRANSNASKIESAHEFGTTLDIAYRRFKAPAEEIAVLSDPFLRDSLLEATANLRSGELQAVLGRVLAEMQSENKVLVRMERRQTVYHITVGR
ncbi:MAG: DUF5715 family protein [Gemmatimonadota bacterium]